MSCRATVILVSLAASQTIVAAGDRLPPSGANATARIESVLRSNRAASFQGKLSFLLDQTLSPGGSSGDRSEPQFIRQSWQIETDGESAIVGRIQYEAGSSVESPIWFGENSRSIWWTAGDSLIILHKSFLNSERGREHQVEASCIQQLIRQARQEIGNILGSGRLSETSELQMTQIEPTGAGFSVRLSRSGIPGRTELKDVDGVLHVSSLTESYPGAEISWTFDDFRNAGELSFPSALEQRSIYSDGRDYRFTYREVGVSPQNEKSVQPRRFLDASTDRVVLGGVSVIVTHELDESSVTPVAKQRENSR